MQVLEQIRKINPNFADAIRDNSLVSQFNVEKQVILVPTTRSWKSFVSNRQANLRDTILLQIIGPEDEIHIGLETMVAKNNQLLQSYGNQVFNFTWKKKIGLYVNNPQNNATVLSFDEGPNGNQFWTVSDVIVPKRRETYSCVQDKYEVEECKYFKNNLQNAQTRDIMKSLCNQVCRGKLSLVRAQTIAQALGQIDPLYKSNPKLFNEYRIEIENDMQKSLLSD